MVLNDVITDYQKVIDCLENYNGEKSFLRSGINIIRTYKANMNKYANTYIKSAKTENDRSALASQLNSLTSLYSSHIAVMNEDVRDTMRLITEIEHMELVSDSVRDRADDLCNLLNDIMDYIGQYVTARIEGRACSDIFFAMIELLDQLDTAYRSLQSNYFFLCQTENELQESAPMEDDEQEEWQYLDIRSRKRSNDMSAFAEDVEALSKCINCFEMLASPGSSRTIYLKKLESGSLRGLFTSKDANFAIFPDLFISISNAIHQFRITPAEKKKLEAEAKKTEAEAKKTEAEAKKTEAEAAKIEAETKKIHTETEGMKSVIARENIGFVLDRMNLKGKGQEELAERFCYYLVDYLYKNPQGEINGVAYDNMKDIARIEEK